MHKTPFWYDVWSLVSRLHGGVQVAAVEISRYAVSSENQTDYAR